MGPYPEAKAVYVARSPIHAADKIKAPVILFQARARACDPGPAAGAPLFRQRRPQERTCCRALPHPAPPSTIPPAPVTPLLPAPQGDEDRVVPPEQAEVMHRALLGAGVPTALVMYKGEQHGFRSAAAIRSALEGELYFYGKARGPGGGGAGRGAGCGSKGLRGQPQARPAAPVPALHLPPARPTPPPPLPSRPPPQALGFAASYPDDLQPITIDNLKPAAA
jgi:hypothetical protein